MIAIIFAGGVGTRLWPLSRKKTPKQFMGLVNNKTMLQLCVDRLVPGFDMEDIYIATGKDYVKDVKKQLTSIKNTNIIAEPETRDVGPAVGLVAAIFAKIAPTKPIVLLWGSDHLVKKEGFFRRILKSSAEIIKKDPNRIILVGQKPRFASENLGWIEFGNKIVTNHNIDFFQLKGYKYRPDKKTAQKYFKDNRHSWNLGYWVTSPKFLWDLYKQHAPEIYLKLKRIQQAYGTKNYQKVLSEIYPKIEKISFDNAIIEKMSKEYGLVVSAELGWSDVGAWEALKEALQKSQTDNVTQGKVLLKECVDCLVYNYDDNKTVVAIELNDALIVNTNDVLLVTKKTSVPKVKKLVQSLKKTRYKKLT